MVVRFRRERLSAVLAVLALDIPNPTFSIETGVSLMAEVRKMINLGITEGSIRILGCIPDVFRQSNKVFLRHVTSPCVRMCCLCH
jgi:hypothetical protein